MKPYRIAGVLAALTILLGGCNSDTRQLLDQAESRWRDGNYDDAIRLNMLVYERDPRGRYAGRALMNLGNIYYLNQRRLNEAIEAYQKLVAELPGKPEALSARERLAGIYANDIGDLTQAIHEYEKLLASEEVENRAEIRFRLADAYFRLNDFDRALRELRRLQEQGISGHLADQVNLKIGNVYQIRKRHEDALVPLQAVSESPCLECRRRALLNLMETHEQLYDFDKAMEDVRKLDPNQDQEQIQRELARLADKRKRVDSGKIPFWDLR